MKTKNKRHIIRIDKRFLDFISTINMLKLVIVIILTTKMNVINPIKYFSFVVINEIFVLILKL
jgi:hypothetical protein